MKLIVTRNTTILINIDKKLTNNQKILETNWAINKANSIKIQITTHKKCLPDKTTLDPIKTN